jgi:hypothetical protein
MGALEEEETEAGLPPVAPAPLMPDQPEDDRSSLPALPPGADEAKVSSVPNEVADQVNRELKVFLRTADRQQRPKPVPSSASLPAVLSTRSKPVSVAQPRTRWIAIVIGLVLAGGMIKACWPKPPPVVIEPLAPP